MPDSTTGTPAIAVLATLDTKGAEARLLADAIRHSGASPVVVDASLRGDAERGADIPRSALEARGATVVAGDDRTEATASTGSAAAALLAEMVADGEIAGAVAVGGGTGGWIAERAFEDLPFGFPALIVTTVVKPSGERDILYFPSVVDVAGDSALLRSVLGRAAAAISGMARVVHPATKARPAVAMTMFGVTTAGGDLARRMLEDAGYDVVVFHATGAGGRTMERLVREGRFAGVLDWTTTEIVQNIAGGLCDAGPDRLRAAAAAGVPQVVVPGAIDVINVLPPIPDRFADRTQHLHLPTVPLVRASAQETAAVGAWAARALVGARAVVLVPARGFSSIGEQGGPFHDPATDAEFAAALRRDAPDLPVRDIDAGINSAEFASAAATTLLELIGGAAASD